MSYSFFGTCACDYKQFFACLKTMLSQSIIPREIILVNSGDSNIEPEIIGMIKQKKIKLIYIQIKLNRVKSLNLALSNSTSQFSFRFDSRSRFSSNYAENALKILNDNNLDVSIVGGAPSVISDSIKFEPKLCAAIMGSFYLFFFPRHRTSNYSGYCSSIYLGCFVTSLLKEIKFNEKKALLSEDSLIINDFLERGYKSYISSSIKLDYVCRSSLISILKLFNTYGYCRANTILVSKKLFISKRHFFVLIALSFISLTLFSFSFFYITLLPFLLIIFNIYCEVSFFNKRLNLLVPIYGTLCQFSWIAGFIWNLLCIFKNKQKISNFIS